MGQASFYIPYFLSSEALLGQTIDLEEERRRTNFLPTEAIIDFGKEAKVGIFLILKASNQNPVPSSGEKSFWNENTYDEKESQKFGQFSPCTFVASYFLLLFFHMRRIVVGHVLRMFQLLALRRIGSMELRIP